MRQIIVFEKINYYIFFKFLIFSIVQKENNISSLYYFYTSINFKIIQLFFPNFSKNFKKLTFNLFDMKKDNRYNIFVSTSLIDSHLFFKLILKGLKINEIKKDQDFSYFKFFFKKNIFENNLSDYRILKNLLMINALNIIFNLSNNEKELIFFLEPKKWHDQIQQYSISKNVQIKFNKLFLYLIIRSLNNNFFISKVIHLLKFIKNIKLYFLYLYKLYIENFKNYLYPDENKNYPIIIESLLDYINNTQFWNHDFINSNNTLFVNRVYNAQAEKIKDNRKSINFNYYCLLNTHYFSFFKVHKFLSGDLNKLNEYKNKFEHEKSIWKKTFNKFTSKIYITTHKWSPSSIAASSAINDLNGVSIFYQTSYYDLLAQDSNIKGDIYFAFSNLINQAELEGGSEIDYIISCGYIKDYSFKLVKNKSLEIRNNLLMKGCKNIIAYFDQGYDETFNFDERFNFGQNYFMSQYVFWLEKLIHNPDLGLIIKSKKPGQIFLNNHYPYKLVKGLKTLEPLLNQALSTGRCIVYRNTDYSTKNTKDFVAEASMSADISIHNMLYAGTAGIESALSGTPTLLYDGFNFYDSQFYLLGKNKVVFDSWDCMWYKIQEFFNDNKNNNIGDWSKIINNIDPFRDGKASFRINQFVYWLHEGFKNKKNKNEIILDAVQKYSDMWGSDKIIKN